MLIRYQTNLLGKRPFYYPIQIHCLLTLQKKFISFATLNSLFKLLQSHPLSNEICPFCFSSHVLNLISNFAGWYLRVQNISYLFCGYFIDLEHLILVLTMERRHENAWKLKIFFGHRLWCRLSPHKIWTIELVQGQMTTRLG